MNRSNRLRLLWVVWRIAMLAYHGSSTLQAQSYFYDLQEIGSANGLESVVVHGIYEGTDGFIWITTNSGLARFDGYSFKYFKNDEFLGGMSDRVSIAVDNTDNLWVVLPKIFKGKKSAHLGSKISIFNPSRNTLIPFKEGVGKSAPFFEQDVRVLKAYDGIIFAGLIDGRLFSYNAGNWKLIYGGSGLEKPIEAVAFTRMDQPFWLKEGDSIRLISPNGKRIEATYYHNTPFDIWGFNSDPENRLMVVGAADRYKIFIKIAGKPRQSIDPEFKVDYSAFKYAAWDRQGRVWCWVNDAYHVYQKGLGKILEVPAQGSILDFPRIHFDRNNLAWIATREGIKVVQVREKKFQKYLTEEGVSVRGMLELGPSEIWANTNNGVYAINPLSGSIKRKIGFRVGYGMAYKAPYCWIGAHGNSILKVHSKTLETEIWNVDGLSQLESSRAQLLLPYIDRTGKLWVGTNLGLMQADTRTRTFKRDARFNTFDLSNREVNSFYENAEGLWVTTDKALYLIDPKRGVQRVFKEAFHANITFIHEQPAGVFWLARRGGGLVKWSRKDNRFEQFGIEEGLPNENVHAVLEDSLGRFWLPTDRGLALFNPQSHAVQVFYQNDGITHDEFNRQSYLKALDGKLYIGGLSGINSFAPKDFNQRNPYNFLLQVAEYAEWDPQAGAFVDKSGAFLSAHRIVLDGKGRSFQIKFALLNYSKLAENRYAYRVEGLDKDWITIRENYLRFTGLPYGRFILHIKGAAADGGWSANELFIPIEVKRPFFLKSWFIALSLGILIAFIFVGTRIRLYRLRRTKKDLEQEVAARTAELEKDKQTIAQQNQELEALNKTKDSLMAIIGHELRGPMLSIQNIGDNISYLLKNGQFSQAASLGQQVKHRVFSVRMLLDNMLYWGLSQAGKQEVYLESVSVHALMVEVIELVEFWMGAKNLYWSIDCPDNLFLKTDRNMLRMVLLNLLTNAIKFTKSGGTITLYAKRNTVKPFVEIYVSDTGQGLSAEKIERILSGNYQSTAGTAGEKGTGMGLALCRKLLERLDGTLHIAGIPDKGSTFEIRLSQSIANEDIWSE